MSVQLVSTQQQELGWSSGLLNSSQAKRKLPECVQVCVSGSWVKEQAPKETAVPLRHFTQTM